MLTDGGKAPATLPQHKPIFDNLGEYEGVAANEAWESNAAAE